MSDISNGGDENVKTYYDVETKQIQSCSTSESVYSCTHPIDSVTIPDSADAYNYPWMEQTPVNNEISVKKFILDVLF